MQKNGRGVAACQVDPIEETVAVGNHHHVAATAKNGFIKIRDVTCKFYLKS